MKAKRKIIQICTVIDDDYGGTSIIALCDDGSIWRQWGTQVKYWHRIKTTTIEEKGSPVNTARIESSNL